MKPENQTTSGIHAISTQSVYGFGQMLLLEPQGQLIVVAEDGDLALINATPTKLDEVARIPGVNGKTWNHPIVVQDKLFLRNGAEAVCFGLR